MPDLSDEIPQFQPIGSSAPLTHSCNCKHSGVPLKGWLDAASGLSVSWVIELCTNKKGHNDKVNYCDTHCVMSYNQMQSLVNMNLFVILYLFIMKEYFFLFISVYMKWINPLCICCSTKLFFSWSRLYIYLFSILKHSEIKLLIKCYIFYMSITEKIF